MDNIGSYPVDICEYSDSVETYLIQRGARVTTESSKYRLLTTNRKFVSIHFDNCKPVAFSQTFTRIFFPSEDEAVLFSLVFGHLITNSYIPKIRKLLEDRNE